MAAFKCPANTRQAFLWDESVPGLALRTTPSGAPSYVFQGRFQNRSIRITIGSPTVWSIPDAQAKARSLQRELDEGRDPRQVKAAAVAAVAANNAAAAKRAAAERRASITTREVWSVYVEERRPHWGERHYLSHLEKASPGGIPSKQRGMQGKLTKPGPLAPLMDLRFNELTAPTIEKWAANEGKVRPSSARLAHRQLTVFLNWCYEQPAYADLLPQRNPATTKRTREALGRPGVKDDVLNREQLPAWFTAVRNIPNPVISAALQTMLLTGARPGEILDLRWADLDMRWKSLTIRDKVEGERVIPLTPYVLHLLDALPRRNEWVFSSAKTLRMDSSNQRRRIRKANARGIEAPPGEVLETSQSGRIAKPNTTHSRACQAAGLNHLTLHGLRRSFASLTEWLETPTGVVAQIQGHKPSATAEKHYKRRPLDLLRLHHERIEAWILEQAGLEEPLTKAETGCSPIEREVVAA